jgi:16S rRNA processing protein RimM
MPRRPPPEASAADPGTWVCLAELGAAKGVRGALRLNCFNENPADVVRYTLHAGPGGPVLKARILEAPKPGQLVVAIEGVNDRDAAAALTGTRLYTPRDALPPPDEDEFYNHDLIGLAVFHVDGRELGRVAAVLDHGAGTLLDVEGAEGIKGFVLPFTREAVPTVDVAGGRVVADPPAGLLDDV